MSILTICAICTILAFLISYIMIDDWHQSRKNQENFMPKSTLVWMKPDGKVHEFRDPSMVLTRNYNEIPSRPQRPQSRQNHQRRQSDVNNCLPDYAVQTFNRCQQLAGQNNKHLCNCSSYCHCLTPGGDLTRCNSDINYQKCLKINNGNVKSCQHV